MPRRKRRITDDEIEAPQRTRSTGRHTHVAEIHGESETLGLRDWARRAVLSGGARR